MKLIGSRLRSFLLILTGMAASALAQPVATFGSAESAQNYITNGLIAHWDGVENSGYGLHDAAATSWVELRQNLATTATALTFEDGNHAYFNGTAKTGTLITGSFPAAVQAIDRGAFTADCCYMPRATTQYSGLFHFGVSGTTRYFSLSCDGNGNVNHDSVGALQAKCESDAASRYTGTHTTTGVMTNMTAVMDGSVARLYAAGDLFHSVADGGSRYLSADFQFGRYQLLDQRAKMNLYAVRLYDRRLTPDEMRWNACLDRVRFAGAESSSLDWPATIRVQDGVMQFNVSVSTAAGWVSINGGGFSAATNAWFALGETVTVAAASSGHSGFERWTGQLPEGIDSNSPTVTFTCRAPWSFVATHHTAHFVSTSGEDAEGRGTAAQPYRTIQYAVNQAAAQEWIHVAGGEYVESVSLSSYRNIAGCWNSDFTARDLKNGRTVIRSTANNKATLSIASGTGTNVIDALTLTGGSYGLYSKASGGSNDSSAWHHVLTRLIVTNNINGIYCDNGFNGVWATACVIADNSGYGYYHNADHGTLTRFWNCTFARNGKALYRTGGYVESYSAYNCAFVDNDYAWYTSGSTSTTFDRCLFHGNTVREKHTGGTQSTWTAVRYLLGTTFGDAKLGADFAPGAGSAAIGNGTAYASVTSDVYGEPFDGSDIGVVKASVAAPARFSDTYVATTGDDANAGTDASHPKKSINAAVAILADSGTCHVADGTYVEDVALSVPNMTLVGATTVGTILKSETGTDATTKGFAVGLFAPNVVVSNLTCASSGAGAFGAVDLDKATKPKLVRCVLSGNCFGYRQGFSNSGRWNGAWSTLTHVQVRDSIVHGIYAANVLRLDNVLIADNGQCGIYSECWNLVGDHYFNNITVTGNGTYGYYFDKEYSPSTYCYNSIFEDCATKGVHAARGGFHAYKCCFYGNGNDNANTGVTDEKVGGVTSCIYSDPLLDTTATLRGHLAEHSPCSQTGGDYSAKAEVPSTTDLDYMKRLVAKMDIGCYISPETTEELAGEGYYIISVEGDPNGYGTPAPGYGRRLLEEGMQRLDARGTLYTEELDGVRASRVTDGSEVAVGVRAAYKGYAFTRNGESEPAYASDTDEYVDVNLTTNSTMTWKWERQNKIVVSTDAPGCKVQINDGTPAACVTNWIAQDTAYTVTFIPTSDFEFDSWSGEFPSTADPRYQTTTVLSDSPRSLVPRYRKLIHVATDGDDTHGLGTADEPYQTIAHAISVANPRDVIYVKGGEYTEGIVSTVNELTIAGGYDANWERDLVGYPTVIKPGTTKDCVTLNSVVSNTIKGLVLTGGRYGINMGFSGSYPGDEAAYQRLHTFQQLVITNNANTGVRAYDFKRCGFRLISSLVARNGGHGIYAESDWGCSIMLMNCSIVDNANNGIQSSRNAFYTDMRNCLVAGNGGDHALYLSYGDHSYVLSHNLFSGGKKWPVDCTAGLIITGGGNVFLEPKTNANWTLAADSPCVAAGYNLHADPRCSMLEDLNGTPWNGVYDIGCFKSAHTPTEKLDDVYVSPDGDDANTGADAAHPLKTPALGALRLADYGTLHFAAGVYTNGFSVTAKGATVRGAGAKETVFTVGAATTDLAGRFAIDIAADNVTVEQLSSRNGTGYGINLGPNTFAREALVRDCAFVGCQVGVNCRTYYYTGVFAKWLPEDKGADSSTWAYHRLSRCVITDNATRGIDVKDVGYIAMRGDNLLIARNGTDGVHCRDRNGSQFYVASYFYYCTIADNGNCGVLNRGGDYGRPYFYNSIFTGNKVGLTRSTYDVPVADHCVVSGNGTNFEGDFNGFTNGTTTAEMRYKGGSYRPARDAVALGLARALTASDKIAEPETDLIGRSRYNQRRERDSGCYVRDHVPMMLIVR